MGVWNQDRTSKEIHAELVTLLPRLRRFCFALAGSADAGDDLCQEAVARALANANRFTPGTRLDNWVFRIARNVHIDAHRRRKTRGPEVEIDEARTLSGDDGRSITEARSDFARVRSDFLALPEDQRVVMLLVAVEGLSYQDAADALEIPMGTVMSRLWRARRALDRKLHGDGEGTGG